MKVDYINHVVTDTHARCTFIGYNADGSRRRPVIELDSGDLTRLIEIAKEFRSRQRRIASYANSRAQNITDTGLTENK